MNNEIVIKYASPADLMALKSLRAQALIEEPLAFSKSPQEYSKCSDEQIIHMLSPSNKSSSTLLAIDQSKCCIGMIGYHININRSKIAHAAEVNGLYVQKKSRNLGIATLLVNSLVSSLKQNESIKFVYLSVNACNNSAINLYKKFGFQEWGRQPSALKVSGTYYDLIHMFLKI
jgi:RimJ/RimL family protein N-acetyltransferase